MQGVVSRMPRRSVFLFAPTPPCRRTPDTTQMTSQHRMPTSPVGGSVSTILEPPDAAFQADHVAAGLDTQHSLATAGESAIKLVRLKPMSR